MRTALRTAALLLLLAAPLLASAAAAPDAAFFEDMRKFEHELNEVERSMFAAAAAKSGSALQKDMERRFSELASHARRLQLAVNATALRREINLYDPVNRLNNVFTRLSQGKERPARGLSLRRTSTGEFHRTKRSDIAKIRKSEGSEEEKAAAIEDLYDEWLSTTKNDNLKRCSRVSSSLLRSAYEDSALALFDLRHMLRELHRSKTMKTPPPAKKSQESLRTTTP